MWDYGDEEQDWENQEPELQKHQSTGANIVITKEYSINKKFKMMS